jgi:hypothetical protein
MMRRNRLGISFLSGELSLHVGQGENTVSFHEVCNLNSGSERNFLACVEIISKMVQICTVLNEGSLWSKIVASR